jgi:hypothetical protein
MERWPEAFSGRSRRYPVLRTEGSEQAGVPAPPACPTRTQSAAAVHAHHCTDDLLARWPICGSIVPAARGGSSSGGSGGSRRTSVVGPGWQGPASPAWRNSTRPACRPVWKGSRGFVCPLRCRFRWPLSWPHSASADMARSGCKAAAGVHQVGQAAPSIAQLQT